MFSLFHPKTTKEIVLTRNGEYILDRYITRSLIKESIDGTYELDFTLMVGVGDSEMYDLIAKGSIIKVDDEHGEEVFRIEAVNKNTKYIDVYCRQITIDECLSLWLEDVRPTDLNGQSALQYLVANAKGKHELTVSSDIKTTNTAYYIRKNLFEAITSEETAFLRRWGGEIKRRGYNLYINSRIGEDKGFTIESRKNLTGFNIKEENTVITGIKPVGFDGITADIVYSENRELYPRDYIKEIKWEDVRLKSEEEPEGFETLAEAQKELTRLAKREFEINKVDQIHAEYEVNFIELADTEEYKDLVSVQASSIGDDITVKIDTLGVDLKARCIERTYSPTLKRRITTTISTRINTTIPPKPSDILQQIQQQLPANKVPTLSDYIDSMITSGFKNSYYISRPNEALWLDNPDINKAKKVVRMNKNGLGFSQTGYYGKYTYGFTIDGKINADLITVGQLNGALIKAGTLTADKIEVGFKQEIKNDVEGLIKESFGDEIKEEIKNDVTNIVLQDYVTKSEFTADKNGIKNEIQGIRKEVTTKVTEIGEDTNNKIKEVNNSISKIDTKFSTANGRIEQQVKAQSQTIQNVYNEVEGQEQQLIETNKILSETKSSLTTDLEGVKANVKEVSKTTGTISTKLDNVNKDLSEKINSTLNSAKNYTNTELKTVREKVTTNESNLNVLKNEINSKVGQEEVEKVVSDIKIGGRNLALNTSDNYIWLKTNDIVNGGTNNILEGVGNCEKVLIRDLNVGDTIVIRLVVKWEQVVSVSNDKKPTLMIQGYGNKTGWGESTFPMSKSLPLNYQGNEKVIEYTGKINAEHLKNDYFIVNTRFDYVKSGRIYIKDFKVEKGNKATAWTPAPEDTKQLVTDNINVVTEKINSVSSELKQTKEGFEASVKGLNETTKTISTRVENVNASLTNKINTDVKNTNTSLTNKLNTDVKDAKEFATSQSNAALQSAKSFTSAEIKQVNNKVSNVESSLKVLKDEISSKVSKKEVDTTITNIKIGGRNLALNTSDEYVWIKSNSVVNGGANNVLEGVGNCKKVLIKDLDVGDTISIKLKVKWEQVVSVSRDKNPTLMIQGYGNKTGWGESAFPMSELIGLDYKGNEKVIEYTGKINAEHLKNDYFIVNTRFDYVKSGRIYIKDFKVEKGNKATAWTPAPEDTEQLITDNINVVTEKINSVSSEFKQTTEGFKTQVSQLTETTKTINGNLTALNKKTEEYKSSIEQTQKNIKLEVSKKVDGNKIVSTINQDAENIKIKADKIQLEGATTFGDNGKKVTIDKANYSVNENGIEKAFFGFKNFGTSYDVPKLYMSAQGLGSNENSWFTISSYKGDENPGEGAEPYIDLSYHCYKRNIFDDFSNIKMYNDGNIKIAPVNELKITTNYIGGKYDGMTEHTLAIFNSAKDELFNSNLQIGAIDNKTNTRGLILSDTSGPHWARVRVQADGSQKFFRPCYSNDRIELGSSNYRWEKIFSKNSLDASSDIRLKENINYIKDKQTLKNWGMDCILEEKDLYNFVKDELNLTTYNFTDDKELQIGFLAQDIEGSKVGSKIITKDLEGEENYLSYNTGNYTNVLAGALKEAINKIEKLEQELQEIKSAIIK